MENMTLTVDADGIATLTWNMPGRTMNVLSESSSKEFAECVNRIATDETIKGAIITSGKKDFLAGADLTMLGKWASDNTKSREEKAAEIFAGNQELQKVLRQLETCKKPVVAAIPGTALGGGLEICLACHGRIAADNPKAKLGLPECKVGLLPGAGGTQRLPRMIGAQNAAPLLLQGKELDPKKAQSMGIVDKVVPAESLLDEAKKWIKEVGKKSQPWDADGFKIPGGGPHTAMGQQIFSAANAMLHAETYGNYPAQTAILSCVYEGLQVPIDAALRIEGRYFTSLILGDTAKNMIRTLFLSMQELGKGARRPKGVEAADCRKLGVLGAGMMGAGIAYVSARAGIEVALLDSTIESAQKGKAYSEDLLKKAVQRGKSTQAEADAVLARIKPTTDYADLAGADLVIEAVFEDRNIKADVTKKSEAVIPATSIYASNTSTLPITGLAEASARPDQFIGIHFFSPVDKMMLVEIIMGKKTGEKALAVAIDYVKKIKKTPIVVNDSRGFYTSRCFGTYVNEGILMLGEGVAPALIENAGKMTGMPVAPLAMNDEVSLELSYHIRKQTKKDLGAAYEETVADRITDAMVEKHGRKGKKVKMGFYDYPDGGKKKLWPGLSQLAEGKLAEQPSAEELKTRYLTIQALETARCFEEGVLTDVRDADVGAILGWGFAPWSGGPLSYIDTIGTKKFVANCEAMAKKHGKRFEPCKLLKEMAAKDEKFYDRFNPHKAKASEPKGELAAV